ASSGSRAARHASNTSSKSSYKKKSQPPKKKKRLVLKIFLGLLIAGMVSFLAGVGLFWFYARQVPKLKDDKLNVTVSWKL
ncbi:penicillin-binding protein, partial [Enterococcus faecalis]